MATDNMAGLFATPEQYQQAQLAQVQDQAVQMARLTPAQRASANMQIAGYQLGSGIAGAFGAQDPMLQRQAQRRALIQQTNMADPQSLVQAIQASSNDPELGAFLMGKYKELTGIQKEQSVIEKNKAWEASKTDSEKKRNLLSQVEQDLADNKPVAPADLNRARLAWAQETKPRMFQDPTTGTIQTVPGVDVNLFPNLGKTLTNGGSGGGNKMAGVIETPKSAALKEAEVATAQSAITSIDDSLNAVKGIRDLRTGSISTNPWLVGTLKNYPSAAMAQEDLVKTITQGKVIDTIAEMKAQSKTGATGFGALSGRELDLLESKARRLNPQSPTFETDLKYIEDSLINNKKKIETSLSKKQAAMPSSPANNAAGTEGRIAILQQEYAKAQQMGNQADMAGLTRELATLGAKPLTTEVQNKYTAEQKIQMTLKASGLADNPANRERVVNKLKAEKHL